MTSPAAESSSKYASAAGAFVKENRLPGAAVGVVHEGKAVWSAGFGFADVGGGRPATPTTLYRIASITKTVTATAVMQLRDDDLLALDDPVVAYLPELERARSPFGSIEQVTVRRLLSHESGLQSEPPGTDWTAVDYETDAAKTLGRVDEIATTVAPNTQWKYSNLGYQLLGEVVERVAGMPYPRYVRRRILSPLKMPSTAFEPLTARLRTRRATGYDPRFLSDELEPAPDEAESVFSAEGGLWSCVQDLARWIAFQLDDAGTNDGVLTRKSLDEMHRPRYLMDPEWTRAWAIGWFARRRDDVIWIMHSGGHYGFWSNVCFDPKSKVGAIALLNGFANASELAMQLGALAREAVLAAAPAIEPPARIPDDWRDLPGLYLGEHFGNVVRLEWRDGKLTFLDPDDPTWAPTLAPTDDPDVFTVEPGVRQSGETVRFARRADGGVASVNLAVMTLRRLAPVAD